MVGVLRVEQEERGPGIRDEERDGSQAQEEKAEHEAGRARAWSGQRDDQSVDEDKVTELVTHTDLLGQRRFSRPLADRHQHKVPREGGDGAHPQQPIEQDSYARQSATERKNRGEDERQKEAGILQNEEEIGQAREGHTSRIEDRIVNRPEG